MVYKKGVLEKPFRDIKQIKAHEIDVTWLWATKAAPNCWAKSNKECREVLTHLMPLVHFTGWA